MSKPSTLIITNSLDITVDRLIQQIGPEMVFRFNLDLWEEYQISIIVNDFKITNPTGRVIKRADIVKCLWRKPMPKFHLHWDSGVDQETIYTEAEIIYAIKEIKNILWRENKLILIEPNATNRLGKLVQLEIGQHYFTVPPYEFILTNEETGKSDIDRVVKSLSSERVTDDTYLWTSRVRQEELEPNKPWHIQDLVEATYDVTVVFVRDEMFGFALDRSSFVDQTDDWREVGDITSQQWECHALPADLEDSITDYMHEIGLHYGRLDFMYDGDTYFYLEVNSNGEWDWLDPNGDNGLLDRMVAEIRPDSPLHPIPCRWL